MCPTWVCRPRIDKEAERAADVVDGARSQCGCDCTETGDGFADGGIQRYCPILQNQAVNRDRKKYKGEMVYVTLMFLMVV